MAPFRNSSCLVKNSFFNKPSVSDVKIKFCGRELFAHKVVLMKESKYFGAAFEGGFPVATGHEIDLGDDDPSSAIEGMVRFMYDVPLDIDGDLGLLADIFEMSDKYDVPRFAETLVDLPEHFFHDARGFREDTKCSWSEACNEFMKDFDVTFPYFVQRVCGSSAKQLADSSLQKFVAFECCIHMRLYTENQTFRRMNAVGELFNAQLAGLVMTQTSVNDVYPGLRWTKSILRHFRAWDGEETRFCEFLPDSIQNLAKDQIRNFILPLSVSKYEEIPGKEDGPPFCVWSKLEGIYQYPDGLSACDRCRRCQRLCLINSSRFEWPTFLPLDEDELAKGEEGKDGVSATRGAPYDGEIRDEMMTAGLAYKSGNDDLIDMTT